MYSRAELIILANRYIGATRIAPSTLGTMMGTNDKLFSRLFRGLDCTASSAERASKWFNENWPHDLPWPAEVPRRHCLMAA